MSAVLTVAGGEAGAGGQAGRAGDLVAGAVGQVAARTGRQMVHAEGAAVTHQHRDRVHTAVLPLVDAGGPGYGALGRVRNRAWRTHRLGNSGA